MSRSRDRSGKSPQSGDRPKHNSSGSAFELELAGGSRHYHCVEGDGPHASLLSFEMVLSKKQRAEREAGANSSNTTQFRTPPAQAPPRPIAPQASASISNNTAYFPGYSSPPPHYRRTSTQPFSFNVPSIPVDEAPKSISKKPSLTKLLRQKSSEALRKASRRNGNAN